MEGRLKRTMKDRTSEVGVKKGRLHVSGGETDADVD